MNDLSHRTQINGLSPVLQSLLKTYMIPLMHFQPIGSRICLPTARMLAEEWFLAIMFKHMRVKMSFGYEGLITMITFIRSFIRLI